MTLCASVWFCYEQWLASEAVDICSVCLTCQRKLSKWKANRIGKKLVETNRRALGFS